MSEFKLKRLLISNHKITETLQIYETLTYRRHLEASLVSNQHIVVR